MMKRKAATRRATTVAYRPVFGRAAKALVKSEVAKLREKAEEFLPDNPIEFSNAVDEFYTGFQSSVRQKFSGVIETYGEAVVPIALDEIGQEMDIELADFRNEYLKKTFLQMDSVLGQQNQDGS